LVDSDGLTEDRVDSSLARSQQVLVEFRVIESLRGPQKDGDIIHLRTGLGGGDCGYPFKLGSKFLVDATERNGTLYTGICSLTAPIEQSGVEIESLRMIKAGLRVPDVTGVLYKVSITSDGQNKEPLQGIDISLAARAGEVSLRASTDSLGRFSFPQLPSGAYRVSLGLPPNLSPAFTSFGRTTEQDEVPSLSIQSGMVGGAACHVEIIVDSAASVSGVVKASGSAPLDGWVNADAVRPDGTPWNTVLSAVPSPNGAFRLAHLPPGRYRIQFTSRAGFVAGLPQVIDLRDGEQRSGLILIAK
jgi:hypothetical protein